jgi:hypothetical protein
VYLSNELVCVSTWVACTHTDVVTDRSIACVS